MRSPRTAMSTGTSNPATLAFLTTRSMRAAEQARQVAGVTDVAAVMGTPANRALLAGAGLSSADTPETDVSDLLVAVRATTDEAVQDALRRFAELLSARREVGAGHDERPPRTTWTAAKV